MTASSPVRSARKAPVLWTRMFRVGAFSAVCFATGAFAADLPLARLDSISPAAMTPGGESEVTIAGVDLEGVDTAWFSHPGIEAKLSKEKVFSVRVDSNVPEGIYDMRLLGTHGVSNPRAFYVDRAKTALKSGECSFAKPMEIRVGEAVYGSVAAAARDHFRFAAQKGQRVFVRCMAQELDSRLTPVFAVLDAGGRRLSANQRMSFIDFTAPESGNYVVSLQDVAFAGGADHYYRLSVDEAPVVEAVAPSVVAVGKKTRIQVFGRGIAGSKPSGIRSTDGKELEVAEVEVEPAPAPGVDGVSAIAAAGLETWSFRLRSEKGSSNSLSLLALRQPVPVQVAGPKDPVAAALPGSVSGLFNKGFEGVPIEFEAKKGEVIFAEVFSSRLGESKTNPYLRLTKAGAFVSEAYGPETNTGGPRLNTLHNDPTLRFECKEDGKYTLNVTDLSGAARSGPGGRYVVSLKREEPGFSLVAANEPPPETANDRALQPRGCVLRAGGTAMVRVVAMRSGGFTGEIELGAENLPEGVTSSPGRILAGKNDGVLILRAQPELKRALSSVRIVGRSADGKIERNARWTSARWAVADTTQTPHEPRLARGADVMIATTNAPAPLSLMPEGEPVVEVQKGAKVSVPVRLTRTADLKVPLKIKTGGFAGAETIKEVDADAKAETIKVELDTAALKLPVGRHFPYFIAQAKAKVAGRDVVVSVFSPAVSLVVRDAEKAASPQPDAPAKPGAAK